MVEIISQEKEDFEKQIKELEDAIRRTENNIATTKKDLQSFKSTAKMICDDIDDIEKEMGKSANPALVHRLNKMKNVHQTTCDTIEKTRIRISEQEKMLDAFKEQLAFLKNFVAEFY